MNKDEISPFRASFYLMIAPNFVFSALVVATSGAGHVLGRMVVAASWTLSDFVARVLVQ
jgi:hypothetical protein